MRPCASVSVFASLCVHACVGTCADVQGRVRAALRLRFSLSLSLCVCLFMCVCV